MGRSGMSGMGSGMLWDGVRIKWDQWDVIGMVEGYNGMSGM